MINLTIEINRRNYGLDLVRFLAVSMVLVIHGIQELFHIAIPYFWIIPPLGVELFFSLSGFLIGRILIKKINQDSYSFFEIREFWVRRLLRILPLYLTLYFIYLVFYNLFLYPVKFDFSYLFFLQNLKTAPRFFGESWSLSIEEWFYLLVPLLIFCFYFIFSFLPKPWRGTSAF